ncbi:MAG: putative DNA binding domain-containing protein, partial [Bacilli bacterium]|nr:putative DNA binding domain-containing protein [Bacilli bacterium]
MNMGKENECLEFKQTLAEKEEAMKDIGAILNKRSGGTLYFGVNNAGEVIGLSIGAKTESDIAAKIDASIEPSPYYSVETKYDPSGKAFIEVAFQGTAKPYRAKGVYYIRNAERSEPMPTSLLAEMILQQQQDYDAWESAPSDCAFEDIDEERVKAVFQTGNQLNRMSHPYVDLKDAFSFLHLLMKNGAINKAGEALFSKRAPIDFRLSLLADPYGKNYVDMQRSSGNIFEAIETCYEYVLSKLDVAPTFDEGGVRRGMACELPQLALRELVVNAFGHAYYGAPLTHEIAIYPNRVSIFSPGPFPIDARPEQFASKELKPIDKNDRINNVLYFANYIEHFGTGFTKAFDLFLAQKVSYHYRNRGGGFLFEVYRRNKAYIEAADSDYQKTLSLLRQNNFASVNDVAETLGKSKSTANRILGELREKGKIERVGSDKNGYY